MKTKPTFPAWFNKLPAWEKNEVTRHYDPSSELVKATFLDSAMDFDELLERRGSGEPLEYILRHCHVGSLTLELDQRVLIPRAETETMVRRFVDRATGPPDGPVVDCGTGSGFIAGWLSENLSRSVLASDVSLAALKLARRNVRRNDWAVRLVACDLLAGVDLEAAAIVANLPYVTSADRLSKSVRAHEPELALVPESAPSKFYDNFLRQSYARLTSGGWLWIEASPRLFGEHLKPDGGLACDWSDVKVESDLRGRDRYLILKR